jgi:hypothetical protein
VPIDELTGLLARWHAADGRLARAAVLREAAETLRGLSEADRRALGSALAEEGMERLATPLVAGRDLGGDAGHALADDLLALDTDRVLDVLSSLERQASHLPPPPPGADAESVPSEPQPERRPERERRPEPEPEPRPEPQPEAWAEQPPAEPPVRAEEPPAPTASEPARPAAHPAQPTRTPPMDASPSAGTARRGGFELPQATDAEDALAQLRALPAGWRRRRAAVRWLEEGVLAGADPATVLEVFERIADRRRVADQLLAVGQIDADRLLDQLPAQVVRRLVRRRSRRP